MVMIVYVYEKRGKEMSIFFRDRPLKTNEKYHHYCSECGMELNVDLAYSHKCKSTFF